MPASKKYLKNLIIDFSELLFIAVAIFVLAWLFLVEPVTVNGDSMAPTLHNKEKVVVEKVSLNFNDPQRFEIIVFKSPVNPGVFLIKRVVGMPNDIIKISDGRLYINNEQLNEPYLAPETTTKGKEQINENIEYNVPADSYLLLGDNRSNSNDSRDFGLIKRDDLVGKALVVYYPFENLRVLSNVDSFSLPGAVNKLNYSGDL